VTLLFGVDPSLRVGYYFNMSGQFHNTILLNKDVSTLLNVGVDTPKNWVRRGHINPVKLKHKSSTNNGYAFEQMAMVRNKFFKDSLTFKKKVVLFYSIKGGVGKTTTSAQFAFLCSLLGYKVLAVDIDYQCDFTNELGLTYTDVDKSIYDIIFKNTPIKECIIELNPNLHLLGANEDLDDIEFELNRSMNREQALSKIIKSVKDDYDLILVDCHPAKSLINIAGIYAADAAFVPAIPNKLGYRGVARALNYIRDIYAERYFDGNTNASGLSTKLKENIRIVPTSYTIVKTKHKDYLSSMQADFPGMVVQPIKNSSLYEKASELSLSIFNIKKPLEKVSEHDEYLKLIEAGALTGLNLKDSAHINLLSVCDELLHFLRE
jgi:cellulose biosynthesis protein BcsQ